MNAITDLKNLNGKGVELILSTATQFDEVNRRPVKKVPSLRDVIVYLIGSTIDPVSFTATLRLSADIVQEELLFFNTEKGALDYFKKLKSFNPHIVISNYSTLFAQQLLKNNLSEKYILIGTDKNYFHSPISALSKLFLVQIEKEKLNQPVFAFIGDIHVSGEAKTIIESLRKIYKNSNILIFGKPIDISDDLAAINKVQFTDDIRQLQTVDVLFLVCSDYPQKQNLFQLEYWQRFKINSGLLTSLKDNCLIIEVGNSNNGVEVDNNMSDEYVRHISSYSLDPSFAIMMSVLYLVSEPMEWEEPKNFFRRFEAQEELNTALKNHNQKPKELRNQNFQLHDISFSNFDNCEFGETKFDNSLFCFTKLSNSTFHNSTLNYCQFYKCTFSDAQFDNVVMKNAYFENCTFKNCTFSDCNLKDSFLVGSDLDYCTWENCILNNILINDCSLLNANINHSQLINARIIDSNLSGASVESNKFKADSEFTFTPDSFFVNCTTNIDIGQLKKANEILRAPANIRTSLKQYITFFNEFVSITKGKKINFESRFDEEGVLIEIGYSDDDELDEITAYFGEYLGFIKQSISNISVEFTTKVEPLKKQLFYLELKQEISNLNNRLEIKNFENQTLRGLISVYENQLKKDLNSPTVFLQVSQNNSNNISLSQQMPLLTNNLKDLISFLNDKNVPAEELQELENDLKKANNSSDQVNLKPLQKLREFLLRLDDDTTPIGRTVKASKKALSIAKNIAKNYNKVAQWVGLPIVPEVFVK